MLKLEYFYHLQQEQICKMATGRLLRAAKMRHHGPKPRVWKQEDSSVQATMAWTESWYGHYRLLEPLEKKEPFKETLDLLEIWSVEKEIYHIR